MVANYIVLSFLVLFGSSVAQKCSRLGLQCSSDCNNMILCTELDEDPAVEIPCNDKNVDVSQRSYCQETADGAECGATLPKCGGSGSEGSVKVSCGGFGRFPHPTIPSASITCPEPQKSPTETCYCKIDEIVDRNDLNLECIPSEGATVPDPADCTDLFEFKDMPPNYSYFCADTNDIWVSYKSKTRSSPTASLAKSTRSAGTCEPTSSNGENPGGDTDPPQTQPPATPPPTQPTQPPTTPPPTQPPATPPPTQPPATPPPTQPPATPPPTQPPTTNPPNPNIPKCTKKGQVIADPTNCLKYYFCDKNITPQSRNCPRGKHFSNRVKTCIDGTTC